MEYFFIGLSLPNESFWVNLRPDSENNVIDSELAKTDIGKILLEADVQLKKDTALYTSPQTAEGKKYWDKLYKKAEELYGYDNITIPTLTRPWIVPGEVIIRETSDEGRGTMPSAYIYKATLKVMLEEDYLKVNSRQQTVVRGKEYEFNDLRAKELNTYSTQLIKELIIPKLTKEINTSKRYAKLRQVYYSLILAQWFKQRVNYTDIINSVNLADLTSKQAWSKDVYYQEYQKSFKDGEYSLKEPTRTPLGQVIRSYFSGGIGFGSEIAKAVSSGIIQGNPKINIVDITVNSAMNNNILVMAREDTSQTKVSSALKKKDTISFDTLQNYYSGFIDILKKDSPITADQISKFNTEELSELFQMFHFFTKGVALAPNYKKNKDIYYLERKLINNSGNLPKPSFLIQYLKQKIKTNINDNSVKLAIKISEVASINAAKGLIKTLGLNKDNVVILYDLEINAEQTNRLFEGYNIKSYSRFSMEFNEKYSDFIRIIEFYDRGDMVVQFSDTDGSLVAALPYTPFKFYPLERVSEKELINMKAPLGIGLRKIIVIGSPSDKQFSEFMESYNILYDNLPCAERPLVIIAFRQRKMAKELELLESLPGQSVIIRSNVTEPLPNVTNNNLLILNTQGELSKMYALADVAIVGNDRNLFEPASQKTAILYFDGSWENNSETKQMLAEEEAAYVFSREKLKRLIDSSNEAEKMAEKGLQTVIAYKKKIESEAEKFALQIIGAKDQLRDKFIECSPPFGNKEGGGT